jgi:glycosyltransferase involved in cell wall biosynthesis
MTALLVHEWIEEHGGSENVFEAMARTFPDANIHCLWNDAPQRFEGRIVTESWLARSPLRRSKVAALPFMPLTWARTAVSEADFVLVSSHLFAHHVGGRSRPSGPPKFVYVHTPARYIWAPELDGRGRGPIARAASVMLKGVDAARANQGATFAANSEFVRDRIQAAWGQDSIVLFPPVAVDRAQSVEDWRNCLNANDELTLSRLPSKFLLGASRFVPYKQLQVVIEAGEAIGLPVVLAGSGPQRDALRAAGEAASVPVHVVDRPTDALLYALYQAAALYVFPAVEDFGIMPVEAMALGTPVLVNSQGGARESVELLQGGAVLESLDRVSLKRGVEEAMVVDMSKARRDAREAFGEESFSRRLRAWIEPVSKVGVATKTGQTKETP